MGDYYCDICGKTINRKSKTKHIKSKSHSKMKSYVRKNMRSVMSIGEILKKIFRYYVEANRAKFPIFKTLIECELHGENIKFQSRRTLLYSFDSVCFCYKVSVSKKIRNYISHRVAIMGKKLFPETIINNLSIRFDSYYYIMHPKFRIQQPRRILESKILKHITKLDDLEKENNYGFLSHIWTRGSW